MLRLHVMLRTYEGILKDDRVEWTGEAPLRDRALRVHITVLDEEADNEERGKRMAEALAALSKEGAFSEISDPVKWQRELRRERTLPHRQNG